MNKLSAIVTFETIGDSTAQIASPYRCTCRSDPRVLRALKEQPGCLDHYHHIDGQLQWDHAFHIKTSWTYSWLKLQPFAFHALNISPADPEAETGGDCSHPIAVTAPDGHNVQLYFVGTNVTCRLRARVEHVEPSRLRAWCVVLRACDTPIPLTLYWPDKPAEMDRVWDLRLTFLVVCRPPGETLFPIPTFIPDETRVAAFSYSALWCGWGKPSR